jgi:DNA-binding transcriptional LysR family regulator
LDIRWLQDFLTVAEVGNFTRAADSRNSSQAAFSRRIQSLESWLGVTLVDRSVFPTRLTPEGDRFRRYAADILSLAGDAKGELSGTPAQENIRIAIPYALATASLPRWWADWSRQRNLSCSVQLGNIHDLVTSLVAGNVDLLICFHHAQQPVHLDPEHFDRIVIEAERLRPYAARELVDRGEAAFPGRATRPLPLLMYTPGIYFARIIDLTLAAAPEPLIGRRVLESDMSDVLRDMALAGFGIAWLPDRTVAAGRPGLVPLDAEPWSLDLSIVAFRDRANTRPSVDRLWADLAGHQVLSPPPRRNGRPHRSIRRREA